MTSAAAFNEGTNNNTNVVDQKKQKKSAVEKLYELEAEISAEAGGMRLPADTEITDLMARLLAAYHPNADLRITVSSVRRTTTTKQYYETETPGMVGLPQDQLRDLQSKLMQQISSASFDPTTSGGAKTLDQQEPAAVQRRETNDEVSLNADGSQFVTKRTVTTVSTSQSGISGLDGYGQIPDGHEETGHARSNEQRGIPIKIHLVQ